MPRHGKKRKTSPSHKNEMAIGEEGEVYTQLSPLSGAIAQEDEDAHYAEQDQEHTSNPSDLQGLEEEYDRQAAQESHDSEEAADLAEKKKALDSISELYAASCEATKPNEADLMDAALVWWQKPLAFGKYKGYSPTEVLKQPAEPGKKTPEAYLRWMVNTIMKEEQPDLAKCIYEKTMVKRKKTVPKTPRTSVKDTEAERAAKREKRRQEAAARRASRPRPKTKAELAKELQDLKNRLAPETQSNSGYEGDIVS